VILEIEVQEHHADKHALEHFAGLSRCAALGDNLKVGFRSQQAAQTFPKQNVIVKQ
jgi:hypothetical protein